MPLPPVVIELSAVETASPNASVLIAACSAAVTDGECKLGPESGETRAVVIVSWDAAHSRAHIEIGVPQDGRNRWTNRDLDFIASDPEPERWKSVGLVIGTLVGQAERERTEPKTTAPAPTPPPVTPPPAPAPKTDEPPPQTPPPNRLWLGAELVVGPALDDGSWRFGPGVVGVYDVAPDRVFALTTLRYMVRPADSQDVDARWIGVSLGVGLHHEPARGWRIEGRAETLLERMDATLSSVERDSDGRWLPGMRIAIGGARLFDRWGALTLGLEATGVSKGTLVTLRGERIGRAPPLTWGASAGFRFGFF